MGNIGSRSGAPPPPPPPPHIQGLVHRVPPPHYHRPPGWPPGAAPPPRAVPAQVERQSAVAVSFGVNIKGDSLRLEPEEDGRGLLLAFSFDADAPGSGCRDADALQDWIHFSDCCSAPSCLLLRPLVIQLYSDPSLSVTVYFFAQEDEEFILKATKENVLKPVTVAFKEGRGQEFKQPCGTGIDVSLFEESPLTKVGEGGIFPVACKVEMAPSCNQKLEEGYKKEASKCLVKFAVFVKKDNAEYDIRVVKQILWVSGTRYVLQEIYGIGNTAEKNNDGDDSGKECVICLSEPRDTTVLPCRHMCLCRECAQLLRIQTNKCPICRQPVEHLLEIDIDMKSNGDQGAQLSRS